jgi:hypothetical protein
VFRENTTLFVIYDRFFEAVNAAESRFMPKFLEVIFILLRSKLYKILEDIILPLVEYKNLLNVIGCKCEL